MNKSVKSLIALVLILFVGVVVRYTMSGLTTADQPAALGNSTTMRTGTRVNVTVPSIGQTYTNLNDIPNKVAGTKKNGDLGNIRTGPRNVGGNDYYQVIWDDKTITWIRGDALFPYGTATSYTLDDTTY